MSSGAQSVAGSSDSTSTSRLSRRSPIINKLEKSKSSQDCSKKNQEAVHHPPGDVGTDALAWTPALAQEYLQETYDIEYPVPSCRRLLKEAGLSYRKPRCIAAEAEESEQGAFYDGLKKAAANGRHNSLSRSNKEICTG
jgi:transposase